MLYGSQAAPYTGCLGASALGADVGDITERKRAQQAPIVANRRKDELLAMLGRELRNPRGRSATRWKCSNCAAASRTRRPAGRWRCSTSSGGYGHDEARERSFAAGFDQHLAKPVDLRTLQGLLKGLQ